jgi:hypothetical protein
MIVFNFRLIKENKSYMSCHILNINQELYEDKTIARKMYTFQRQQNTSSEEIWIRNKIKNLGISL